MSIAFKIIDGEMLTDIEFYLKQSICFRFLGGLEAEKNS